MLTAAEAEHLALLATRAPSVHNTQPWHLVVTPEGVDVRADRSRQLAVLDPVARQLLMSCGTVVHHVVVAARAIALEPEVRLLPDPRDGDLVASVQLTRGSGAARPADVALAEAVLHRATNRHRFTDTTVGPGVLEALRKVVEAQGVTLGEIREQDRITVDVLTERAERELLADDAYRAELAQWVFDPDRDGERPDGLPLEVVDPGGERAEDVPGRQFVPQPVPHGGKAEHPILLLLTTTADLPLDWVRAGMALSALLLEATRLALVAQPIGQVTDIGHERARLRADLGVVGVPQMLLRLGEAPERRVPLRTPRREVEAVLSWADGVEPG